MTTKSKVTIEHVNAAIIGFWRMGAKPVEIIGALYEGIHSVGYIEMVIANYLKQLK